jgi:hypothetical protein
VLRSLEGEQLAAALDAGGKRRPTAAPAPTAQLALFTVDPHPAVLRLRATEANATTPLEALRLLDELVRLAHET